MKHFLPILTVFILSFGPLSHAQIDPAIIGQWYGIVDQPSFGTYATYMRISNLVVDEMGSDINYVDLNCGGNISFTGTSDNIHIFNENITFGNCVDDGRIEITKIDENTIDWKWYFGGTNTLDATATFQRVMPNLDLIGTWCGEVFQPGYGTYITEMTIDSLVFNEVSGQTDYTTIENCAGIDVFQGNLNDIHIFAETIIGTSTCIDGRVEIYMINSDTIQWNWYATDGSALEAYGQLGRKNINTVNESIKEFYTFSGLYPNPANEQAQFTIEIKEREKVHIYLLDASGKKVSTVYEGLLMPDHPYNFELNSYHLPSGIYFLSLDSKSFFFQEKFIIGR